MPPLLRSLSATVPPAIGGWNARDPLDGMAAQDAVVLDNFFPGPANVKLRNGFSSHATGVGSDEVETLVEFITEAGVSFLIATSATTIENATSSGAATDITGATTPTVGRWQTVNFRNNLIMVNGTDQPQRITESGGTPSVADAVYTGISDDADLVDVTSYKNRLYFVEKDSASVWYGAVDSVVGALTEFDVQSLFRRGGSIQWVSSWSRDSGSGSQDLLVICSVEGEVLVYQGTDPGNANWSLFGRFFIPVPIGRRSKINFGSDLLIITEQGVVPLSGILKGNEELTFEFTEITDKIQDAFRDVAVLRASNFGWEGILYPRGNYLLINIPIVEDGTSHQYVMNTLTGAWCRFTGQDASTWAVFNEELYFGATTGGIVYKADTGSSDNNANICPTLRQAFNFFNDRVLEKRFNLGRPLLTADNSLTFSFGVDVDFEVGSAVSETTTTGELGQDWGDAWDSGSWAAGDIFSKNWLSVAGVGRSASVKLFGDFKDVNFSIDGFNIVYEPGGIF
jgi:hypothetical protein